jgi:endonuclease-3 related protein
VTTIESVIENDYYYNSQNIDGSTMTGDKLTEIYELLYEYFGPQHWWPGQSTLEIIVGAVLTQNTNWGNVEKAINNLKATKSLSTQRLYNMNIHELAQLIRPAGYYNLKAGRLKNFINCLVEDFNGELHTLRELDTQTLREKLLSIKGIGPETADSILLYAFEKPVFVVDAYTARMATRHGLIESADYETLRDLFQSNLPPEIRLFNEYHALLVRVGKEFCRPRPKCASCPLEKLPHDIQAENL